MVSFYRLSNKIISLCQDIIVKYGIHPTCVVGHNDIAPDRKQDPGPLFPWKELAEQGIGAWPNAEKVVEVQKQMPAELDVRRLQNDLKQYGYPIELTGILDQQTKNVLFAFNRHFLGEDSDLASNKTLATLIALLIKYFPQYQPQLLIEKPLAASAGFFNKSSSSSACSPEANNLPKQKVNT